MNRPPLDYEIQPDRIVRRRPARWGRVEDFVLGFLLVYSLITFAACLGVLIALAVFMWG